MKTAYQDAADTMHAFSYSLINLVFEYTGLPTKFDLETTPAAPTLLLSGGPSLDPPDKALEISELMNDLQSLKVLVSQSEKKEELEKHLSKITGFVAANPKLTPDMLVGGKKLSSIIHDWFSGFEGLYGRLKEIFKLQTIAALSLTATS